MKREVIVVKRSSSPNVRYSIIYQHIEFEFIYLTWKSDNNRASIRKRLTHNIINSLMKSKETITMSRDDVVDWLRRGQFLKEPTKMYWINES